MTGKNEHNILTPNETCWKIASAEKVAVLQNGASYFKAVRHAILNAKKSVFIVGWDIDSRTELVRGTDAHEDNAPKTLSDIINHAVKTSPDIEVFLLIWNYSIVFAAERESLPKINWYLKVPRQLHICMDDTMPVGGSHHQKVVVIDDSLAFCGGLDLTSHRWDRTEHQDQDPYRKDPRGTPYDPYHDLQMMVTGNAAAALGELCRDRWDRASDTPVPEILPQKPLWPEFVIPDFKNIPLGIARTMAKTASEPGIHEIEKLYLKAIPTAEKFIYIENQYLASQKILKALARQMKIKPELEVAVVSTETPSYGWFESRSMGAGRALIENVIKDEGLDRLLPLIYPVIPANGKEKTVKIHSKMMIIDNHYMQIGSANLNNRSMTIDSECDFAFEAQNAADRINITKIRNRLLSEYVNIDTRTIEEILKNQTPGNFIKEFIGKTPGFRIIQEKKYDNLSGLVRPLADPDKPLIDPKYMEFADPGQGSARSFYRVVKVIAVLAALTGLASLWRWTPLADWLRPDRLEPVLNMIAAHPWSPYIVIGGFILGGFILFPVTVMIALTAATFGAWNGFLYAFTGTMISAIIGYSLGHALKKRVLQNILEGRGLRRINRLLEDKGILSVAVIRMVPIAPFTIVNMIMGGSAVRFWDYFSGTVLALGPGIATTALIGDRLRAVWQNPTLENVLLIIVLAVVWLVLAYGMQVLVNVWRKNKQVRDHA